MKAPAYFMKVIHLDYFVPPAKSSILKELATAARRAEIDEFRLVIKFLYIKDFEMKMI